MTITTQHDDLRTVIKTMNSPSPHDRAPEVDKTVEDIMLKVSPVKS